MKKSSNRFWKDMLMPRGNRFQQPGTICHLTHRCHDGSFLFRFGCDRSKYRELLRQAAKEFGVSLLNYCITSSHTHDIAIESWECGISRMMQKLEGEFAGFYNWRKDRRGAFWEDRYHCTMIENGEHLWNCIQYIDLNMVRAGVVAHPSEWKWCGYLELLGQKAHHRLLDIDRVLELVGVPDIKSFRLEYMDRIQRAISGNKLSRRGYWTESIAVGGKDFATNIEATLHHRRRKYTIEETEDGSWAVWESGAAYGTP